MLKNKVLSEAKTVLCYYQEDSYSYSPGKSLDESKMEFIQSKSLEHLWKTVSGFNQRGVFTT